MASPPVTARQRRPATARASHMLTVLRVIAGAEYKLKYSGSVLGYVWSILKPLALFAMLLAVFGHIFRLGAISKYYPLSLLMGIVLFNFFSDATTLGMWSIVNRESLLRKLSFPRLLIPTAATVTAAITFAVNIVVVIGFLVWNGITPQPDWVLIAPLLVELYAFTLGIALILATLFVRLRDTGQIWELVLQLMFYASPIIYPIGFLPDFLRKLVFVNPFTQVLQDLRTVILYPDLPPNKITVAQAFGTSGARLLPIGIALAALGLGTYVFRRDEPWMAERV